MVGVAGKSRACFECKRRRVKASTHPNQTISISLSLEQQCDFRKPSCLRCEKASLSCRGYGKASVFVNRTWSEPSTNALDAISEARSLHQTPSVCLPSSTTQTLFQRLQSTPSTSPEELRSTAFEILKALYLPRGSYSVDHPGTNAYSWVQATCQLRLESRVLDLSLLAFCAVQIHVTEPNSDFQDKALHLYTETLPELVSTLADDKKRNQNETFAAIVVLSTFEVRQYFEDRATLLNTTSSSSFLAMEAGTPMPTAYRSS